VRLAKHQPTLDRAAQKACDAIAALLAEAALEAPSLRELATHVGLSEASARDLLAHLEREHRLVRARPDLWFDVLAIDALRARVLDHFATRDQLDTPAYKALIGTSRRTAVPLMELFDAERLTVRVGEVRKLRRSAS
jgi:selenocysteine-specific elongation factor